MKVCFVRRRLAGALGIETPNVWGGAEQRAATFARALAERPEMSVYAVTGYEEAPDQQVIDKMTIDTRALGWDDYCENAYRQVERCVTLRDRFPFATVHRWTPSLMWQVPLLGAYACSRFVRQRHPRSIPWLQELRPDVVCCFGADYTAGDVIATCKEFAIPSVLFITGDSQLVGRAVSWHQRTESGDFAIHHADAVVVQTSNQVTLLRDQFDRDAQLIRNPINLETPRPNAEVPDQPYAMWIGRADHHEKRPQLCLDVAQRCPDVRFQMVLNRGAPGLYESVLEQLPDNVSVIERVSLSECEALIAQSSLLLNTSSTEGFPNAFLQAARHGVPIVSLSVDPDEMIAKSSCGTYCHGDLDVMADAVQRFFSNQALRTQAGRAGREYVASYHSLPERIDELISLLQSVTE